MTDRFPSQRASNGESDVMPCPNIFEAGLFSQIAKFMGPTWGLPGSCRSQMGSLLAPRTLLSGLSCSPSTYLYIFRACKTLLCPRPFNITITGVHFGCTQHLLSTPSKKNIITYSFTNPTKIFEILLNASCHMYMLVVSFLRSNINSLATHDLIKTYVSVLLALCKEGSQIISLEDSNHTRASKK